MNKDVKRLRRSARLWIPILACTLVAAIFISAGMGYVQIVPGEVVRVIIARATGRLELLQGASHVFPYIVMDVRLPRILTSAVVGAGLSIAGVIFQGILLNPLADPYTLGISAGAAFGASIALLLGLSFAGIYTVPLFAFVGAIVTLVAVLLISSFDKQTSSNSLILAGIIVAAILSAGISFIKYVADEQVSIIIFWLMGSFAAKSWSDVIMVASLVTGGYWVCAYYARDLNVMSLGDRSASSMGIETQRVRMILLVAASLITAGCVSVSGIIGFVGLVIPHLMRFLVGPDNRALLPASALMGAVLLVCADTITRAVLPSEIPIGVLTALIGGPFFCYIFRKRRISAIHGR